MIKKIFSLIGLNKVKKGKINLIANMCKTDYDSKDPTRTMPTDSYMNKLIKSDNNVSVGNFFLVATTIVGLLLLLVPLFVLTIEATSPLVFL